MGKETLRKEMPGKETPGKETLRRESSAEEQLIWVDENDTEIGYGEKMDTHVREQLHRAFSLFLYNRYDGKLLIHRRAEGKYHSGGLWTNSCCSHPRKGEELPAAVIRRAKEELGLELSDGEVKELRELGKFQYYQKYETCAEHEIDHVFWLPICRPEVELNPDPGEISEILWISMEELEELVDKRPEDFTAWFAGAFGIVREASGIWQ